MWRIFTKGIFSSIQERKKERKKEQMLYAKAYCIKFRVPNVNLLHAYTSLEIQSILLLMK